VALSAHLRIAVAARRPAKALHLRDEMREHARLHEAGVISKVEYEGGKARILAAHAPGGASCDLGCCHEEGPLSNPPSHVMS
jgi:hypothetical protein